MRILHSVECSRLSLEFFSKGVYTLSKKFPYLEFFWSVFSFIRTKKTSNTHTFHTVTFILSTKRMGRFSCMIITSICACSLS